MAQWLNGGAKDSSDNSDYKTKAALKREIADKATNVTLYVTDTFGPNAGNSFLSDELPIGVKFTVTGPNPYTSRKWYATVEKLPNGTVKVS